MRASKRSKKLPRHSLRVSEVKVATAVVIAAGDVVNVARVGRESAHKQESASREASGLRVGKESDRQEHHKESVGKESDRRGHKESVGKESDHQGHKESDRKVARGQHVHHAHKESDQRDQGELDVLLNRHRLLRLQRLQRHRLFLRSRCQRVKMFRRLR